MVKRIENDCGNVITLPSDEISEEIFISDNAKERIQQICGKDEFLRISILGGGCAGFQYTFLLDQCIEDGDYVNEWSGGRLVVDFTSLQLLKGSTLIYKKSISGDNFVIDNPFVISQCGCGYSFSVF